MTITNHGSPVPTPESPTPVAGKADEMPEAGGRDRRIEGLLRIIGSQDGNDHELTEEEAELIFDIAEAEPVSDARLARIREGVIRRRFAARGLHDPIHT